MVFECQSRSGCRLRA
ncbi:hypothetical protein MTR67_002652 [Solanum verrucosum]|uniref:Uncharacterized protein n=1 Tax=Solanum verrucosum TaxID=315347 RepID=A0AAF0PQZ9_SOLVR|nr:hypothetical protein MTR67_002652 [Solanum verrucosum]